jgi:hypothetical protein
VGLEKAHGNLLGERAMAEAVGWVGEISRYGPFYTSHLVEKGYCRYLVSVSAKHHDHEIKRIEINL